MVGGRIKSGMSEGGVLEEGEETEGRGRRPFAYQV